jgi:hypothetical protein
MRRVAAALLCMTMAGPAAAQNLKRQAVEAILTRAVLERGAFLACAALDPSKKTAELLVRGWRNDLSDATTVLRAVGYSDDDIRALTDRLDIEKARPKFTDIMALGAYCDVLGDWRTRWARLIILMPQTELRRLFKP